MKNLIISIITLLFAFNTVQAAQFPNHISVNAAPRPVVSVSAPRGGFTTFGSRNTTLRAPSGSQRRIGVQPISTNGFTTPYVKDTKAFRSKSRLPMRVSVTYSSDGTKKVYRNNTSKTASSVSGCYGITYYDRNGRVSRCN